MATSEYTELDRLTGELFRLTRLIERVHARYAARWSDGVERAAYLLLVRLVTDGPTRLSALADAVHSDTSTVSRQVAQLVKLGLVERRADPADGRACLLATTAAGEEHFQDKRRRRNESFDALLDGWSARDRRRLRELVSRFNDDFEDYHLKDIP
jgi:DNA-binding MarR family transcriptional regulator